MAVEGRETMTTKADVAITIHGVGHHDPGEAARRVAAGLGDQRSFDIADFNWWSVVEQVDKDRSLVRISQLSRSISVAAAYRPARLRGPAHKLLGWLLSVNETVWTALLTCIALSPLILLPVFAPYLVLKDISPGLLASGETVLRTLALALKLGFAFALLLLSVGVALIPLGGSMTGTWVVRDCVLTVLRPVLTVLFWVASRSTKVLLYTVAIGCLVLAGFGLVGWILNFVINKPLALVLGSGMFDVDYYQGLIIGLAWAAGISFVGSLFIIGMGYLFASPLKFCRDVFNYVGDQTIRSAIQNHLDHQLAALPEGTNVVILSHSLGTVIAVDSLLNSKRWRRFPSIVLVTSGSPIRRWFQRFFPDLLFPRRADEVADSIRRRSALGLWINVFREKDPVGTALGFANSKGSRDVSTNQPSLGIFDAHFGYWDDKVVQERVVQAIQETRGEHPYRQSSSHAEELFVEPESSMRTGLGISYSLRPYGYLVAAAAGFVLALGSYLSSIDHRESMMRAFVDAAMEQGERTTATVAHQQVWRSQGAGQGYPVQKYVFVFDTSDGIPRRVGISEVDGNDYHCCMLFDSGRLLDEIRRGDNLNTERVFEVDVAYLATQESLITLPDYPPVQRNISWTFIGFGLLPLMLYTAVALAIGLFVSMMLSNLLVPASDSVGELRKLLR